MAYNFATAYTKRYSYENGIHVKGTVADADTEGSLDVELDAIESDLSIPGIHTNVGLKMRGPLAFGGTASSDERDIVDWARCGMLFDVTGYGATGDGTTDDYSAIWAAITAADAIGGGIVYFPKPSVSYLVQSAFDYGSLTNDGYYVTLWGPGQNTGGASTGIEAGTSLNDNMFKVGGAPGVGFYNLSFHSLDTAMADDAFLHDLGAYNIVRNCTFSATGTSASRAIEITDTSPPDNVIIEGCDFIGGFTGDDYVIDIAASDNLVIRDCMFVIDSANCKGGIILDNGNPNAKIEHCDFTVSAATASHASIYIGDSATYDSSRVTISDVFIVDTVASRWGIIVQHTSGVSINDCKIEMLNDTSTGGISVTGGVARASIRGCEIIGNGALAAGGGIVSGHASAYIMVTGCFVDQWGDPGGGATGGVGVTGGGAGGIIVVTGSIIPAASNELAVEAVANTLFDTTAAAEATNWTA